MCVLALWYVEWVDFFIFFSRKCEHGHSRLSLAQSFILWYILLHFWYIDVFYFLVAHLSFSPHSRIISYDCFVCIVYEYLGYTYLDGIFSRFCCGGCSLSSYILFSFSISYVLFYDYMHMCTKYKMRNKTEKKWMQNCIGITKFVFICTYTRRTHREDGFCQGRNIWIRPENKNAKIPFRYEFLTNALGASQQTDSECVARDQLNKRKIPLHDRYPGVDYRVYV